MTAFAAIVQKRDRPPAVDGVAEAISCLGAAGSSISVFERCALIVAPLHRDDPPAPALLPSGVAIAGTIALEAHRHLAATLGAPHTASGAALIGSAYDRWRNGCTDRLGGEYAFALWDPREQALVCARDGLGIRLLYVADTPDAVIVTNVLAAALCHPAVRDDLDEVALVAFLAHGGAADETRTCYNGVRVVPAGHTLTFHARDAARTQLRRHWRFPLPDNVPRPNAGAIEEEYRAVLADAVRDRLDATATSIFLSGGVDSTTIAAAAAQVAPPGTLQAITTRYPRYVDDLELPFARAAAGHLALPLTVLDADKHIPWVVNPADPPLAAPLDEPILADWRDALACAARHSTVALYGEDGDVLLRPPGWPALRAGASVPAIALAAARYAVSAKRKPYLGLRLRERLGVAQPAGLRLPAWLRVDAPFEHGGQPPVLGRAAEKLPRHPSRPETQSLLTSTTMARTFAATIAPETTRRRIELRFPILDTRVIQLVVSVPAIPWCQHKTLPRRAYRGRLPAPVLDRPKTPLRGFNAALVAAWRRGTSGRVQPPGPALTRWIDVDEWTRTLQSGSADEVMAAWRVSVLDTWLAGRRRQTLGAPCIR